MIAIQISERLYSQGQESELIENYSEIIQTFIEHLLCYSGIEVVILLKEATIVSLRSM